MQNFQKFVLILTLLAFAGTMYAGDKKSGSSSKPSSSSSKPSSSSSKPPSTSSSKPPTTSSKPIVTPKPVQTQPKPVEKKPVVEEKKPVVENKPKPITRPNMTTEEKKKTEETITKNEEAKKPPVEEKKPVVENKPITRPNMTTEEKKKTEQTIVNNQKVETKPVENSTTTVPPVTSSTPNSSNSTPNSSKPNVKFDSGANLAIQKEQSAKKFQAATAPKQEYKAPSGQTVAIKSDDAGVKNVRENLNPDRYATRSTRIEHHYHNHYGSRYDYYRTQPYVYVGGGYDSLFWYAMMDWSLERRAMWLYNNQNTINQQLYAQQLADNAQLRAEIEALKQRGQPVNPHYVDPEFKDDPDVMYSNEYVEAAYNPEPEVTPVVVHRPRPAPVVHASNANGWIVFWVLLSLGIVGLLIYIVFIHDWKV